MPSPGSTKFGGKGTSASRPSGVKLSVVKVTIAIPVKRNDPRSERPAPLYIPREHGQEKKAFRALLKAQRSPLSPRAASHRTQSTGKAEMG